MRPRQITFWALLVALAVVLTRFASVRIAIGGVEGIRLGFGALPIIMAGVYFGPLAGGVVGAVADVVGFFLSPMGAYMPHFTLTSALTGAIPGLVRYRNEGEGTALFELFIFIGIGQALTSVLLVPYFLQTLFGVPMAVTLFPRLVAQVIQIPVYSLFLHMLTDRLRQANLILDNNI